MAKSPSLPSCQPTKLLRHGLFLLSHGYMGFQPVRPPSLKMPRLRVSVAYLLFLISPVLVAFAAARNGDGATAQRNAQRNALAPAGDDLAIETRVYMDAFPAYTFARRQYIVRCKSGQHSCLELGLLGEGVCCDDTKYCFFNGSWVVQCCAFGSTCGSECGLNQIMANRTTTIVVTESPTSTRTDAASDMGPVTLFESTTTSVQRGCAGRPCTGSQYQCPSSLGGKCCPVGQTCVSNGCLAPPTSPAPTTEATIVPTISSQSDGLSQGAKAGIGVGVVVVAAIIIGALTWLGRRESRRSTTYRSSAQTPPPPNAPGDMSEASGPSRPAVHQSGLAYDYFGPDAVAGPYTDQDGTAQRTPNLLEHGVPVRPRQPSDIAAPVELDSRLRADKANDGISRNSSIMATPVHEAQEGPFELFGSPGSPSPPSPDGAALMAQSPGASFSPRPPPRP